MEELKRVVATIVNEFQNVTFATFLTSIIRALGFSSDETVYRFKNGISLLYAPNTHDVMVIRECFINRVYTKYIKEKKLDTVVDLGAHKGYFILGLLNSVESVNTAICVEPLEGNKTVFSQNIKNNMHVAKRAKNIYFESVAVSTKKGTVKFYVTRNSVSHSLYEPFDRKEVIDTPTVSVITLEELFRKYQLKTVDLIKIDIEGEEFNLFDSPQVKYIFRSKCILMEIHRVGDRDTKSIIDKLTSNGYEVIVPGKNVSDVIFAQKIKN